ncbi:hypothetical protein RHMOL_Rhmol13G0205700 [Rhododendron molle]|uniref:Uncharacterized protein n=1 Tax=Rhododendron molle TaxID=49168 RepID=A0ACC0L8P4_RHOML|nr:hypothetical protein RHMOL_Rhmol13G0205700 [Rhododendron molle]
MDKLSPTTFFLLLVLFYASDTLKIKLVAGQTCTEILGECLYCESKCNKRYPGSTFDCEPSKATGGFPACVCSFKCPTQCRGGGDVRCSAECGPECCNKNCAAKYNSGSGYCDNSVGHNLCQCVYACS